MPASKKKLHELAAVVPEKTIITDSRKQRFVIGKEFARGGFGRIYSARQENSEEYGREGSLAVKIEPQSNGPLFTEITVFQRILLPEKLSSWLKKKKITHVGLPPYVSSGLFTHNSEKLRFLIMPCYEKSLETYRITNGGTLDMRVVLPVAKQCADCLSYMQDHDYVHGDLKADNILLASADDFSRCFLVDFGLAKMAKGNVEKPDRKRAHNGTILFTSLDAHRGCAPSYRGDLEILVYNIIYWLCGMLPWQKFVQKPEVVMAEKEKFAQDLDNCIKKLVKDSHWTSLAKLLKIAYGTSYEEKVDYGTVHSVLNQIKVPAATVKSSKSYVEKENRKMPRTRSKLDSDNLLSSTARKRRMETMDFAVVLTDEQLLHKDDKSDGSVRVSTRKATPICNKTPSSSVKAGDSESGGKSIKLKKRRSDRIGNRLLFNSSSSSSARDAKSSKDTNGKLSRAIGEKCPKKSNRKLRPGRRTGLRSITKPTTSAALSSTTKYKYLEVSPGEKLRTVIPGVRNMKNVRRSLKDTLVKKYTDVIDQAE